MHIYFKSHNGPYWNHSQDCRSRFPKNEYTGYPLEGSRLPSARYKTNAFREEDHFVPGIHPITDTGLNPIFRVVYEAAIPKKINETTLMIAAVVR